MALFYQLQFEAGYQPLLHLYTYTAVDSGRLKTTCDHQQFLRSLTTWQRVQDNALKLIKLYPNEHDSVFKTGLSVLKSFQLTSHQRHHEANGLMYVVLVLPSL